VNESGDLALRHPRPHKLLHLVKQLLRRRHRLAHPRYFGRAFTPAQSGNHPLSRDEPVGESCIL
jgi:hypothetical protein